MSKGSLPEIGRLRLMLVILTVLAAILWWAVIEQNVRGREMAFHSWIDIQLIGVGVITALIFALFMIINRYVTQLDRLVRERTQRLNRTNEALNRQLKERRKVENQLLEAKEAAEGANRAKSEFIANMSHELRTPLNAILGYTQFFKRDPGLDAKQQGRIDVIHSSGEHLLMIINDILDLSKIDARRMEIRNADFHLHRFAQNISKIIGIHAQEKGIDFEMDLHPDLPQQVVGDETRLRQVLLNILGNAVKFTSQGGVLLSVSPPADSSSSEDEILFEVEDTGTGIPEEELEEIFLPFHQVDHPHREIEGTGLGLAISQRLLQLMNSHLHVRSRSGKGSLFWFILALPRTDLPAEKPAEGGKNLPGENHFEELTGAAIPRQEILLKLKESALRGNVTQLRQQSQELAEDPAYSAFAGRVLHLADDMMIEELQEYIGKYTEVQ